MDYWEQKTVPMLKIALLLCSIIVLVSCTTKSTGHLPYYNEADFTPLFLSVAEAQKKVQHTIADFALQDQYGNTITQKDIEGKIHIANFFFTRCGTICPKMTNNLLEAQKKLQNLTTIVILSYSVTPWQDSVARLKDFAERFAITTPNWHLLTGNKQAIYDLARKSYFAEENLGLSKDSSEFLHTEHILLVDKHKKIRGIYNGTLPLETEQLVKDVQSLEAEE